MFVDETRPMYKVYITQLVFNNKDGVGKKGDRGARVWRVGTGTGVCGEGWGEEGDGTEADRRGRQKEEEELGVGCGCWDILV